MAIQLFIPTFRIEECLKEIRECLEKGWTGVGYKTLEFEKEWKKYTGYNNAHFLNSATAGLHLAINILKNTYNWDNNSEIITTALTFVSTNHAILYEELKPIFADIDNSLCLDPKDIKNKITDKTKAIVFVGIGGNIGKYQEVVQICKENNLKLILDAAHMSGTRYNGEIVGKEADVVINSFQAVKNLPTGDSGMICFKDNKLDDKARKLSWMGINKDTYKRINNKGNYKWEYDISDLGYKYNGNSIMASIGIAQLKYLDLDNAYRRQLYNWYKNNLKNYKKLIKLPTIPKNCESSCHLFLIQVKNRNKILSHLYKNEIYPGVHYKNNMEYDLYKKYENHCPKVVKACNKIISLPMHLKLTKKDIDYICEKLIEGVLNEAKI